MKLKKMTTADYQRYLATAIKAYAEDKVAVGAWSEENALDNAKSSYQRLLPDALNTPNHYLYQIFHQDSNVGYIWFAKDTNNSEVAFIYDFEIYFDFRNQGLGSQAMTVIETEAKTLGFKKLGLHVFGNNQPAIRVYEKSGFQITDISMQKEL